MIIHCPYCQAQLNSTTIINTPAYRCNCANHYVKAYWDMITISDYEYFNTCFSVTDKIISISFYKTGALYSKHKQSLVLNKIKNKVYAKTIEEIVKSLNTYYLL